MQSFFYICILGILIMTGCENDLAEIDRLFSETPSSVEVAKDVEILYSDSARVRVKILAPTLMRFTKDIKPRDEFPDGLHVDFLDRSGEISSTLDANLGIRYNQDKIIVVRDHVLLQNTLGEKLETSELIWDEKEKIVYTEKYVKITKPEEIITAYGFKANQDFSEYELLSVQAKMKVKDFKEVLD